MNLAPRKEGEKTGLRPTGFGLSAPGAVWRRGKGAPTWFDSGARQDCYED